MNGGFTGLFLERLDDKYYRKEILMTNERSKITFLVPGYTVAASTRGVRGIGAASSSGPLGAIKATVRVGSVRAGGEPQRLEATPGEDIVALHVSKGPTLFLHPENARDLLAAQSFTTRGSRAADTRIIDIPSRLQWAGPGGIDSMRGAARGLIGDIAIETVEIIAGPFKNKTEELVASKLAERIDNQVVEGVYKLRVDALSPLKGTPMVASVPHDSAGASLVFIHGTFSRTDSGFGQLWSHHPQIVRRLFQQYSDRVFALDHCTLQVSPIQNALTLVKQCAPGARLHLVTHSRGGLVAETLVRASGIKSFNDIDSGFFKGPARAKQKESLKELVELMSKNNIRVDRVVRVACPARGTLLASKRLDAYLSIFKWGLELAHIPVMTELIEFLAGVAQRKEDPAILPGLEAMTPESPLIRWLHAAETPIDSELRVISGDLQGDSLGSWVKALTSDAFFWTDNDLVVQTRSMYGGARRRGATFMLDRGGQVTHFNYFGNTRTANAVLAGLTQDTPESFTIIGPLSYGGESASGIRASQRARRAAASGKPPNEKPAVFVLPGILGSHIKVDGNRVWLDLRLFNGLDRLTYSDPPKARFEPDGSIGLAYQELLDFLDQSHHAIDFSFDWRRPIEEEAERLADAVEAALELREKNGLPVRIVAHSMGGLVARAMQLQRPNVWDRMMERRGARLLMLGTPNGGSWAPMQVLSGDDSFSATLSAFGAPFQEHEARMVMAGLPGLLQLQAGLLDPQKGLGKADTWEKLARKDVELIKNSSIWYNLPIQLKNYDWGLPPQEVLDRAIALRQKLDAQAGVVVQKFSTKLALVVGRADFTPDGYELGAAGLEYLNAPSGGDGRVSQASAMLASVPTWRVDAAHGDLPGETKAFTAYRELLETGTTTRLQQVFPDTLHFRDSKPIERSRPIRQIVCGALPLDSENPLNPQPPGFDSGNGSTKAATLNVTIRNEDIKFVREPLMIGHYSSTSLTGVEKQVNWLIGGAMEQSLKMGQYPEAPGTHQLFVNRGVRRDDTSQAPRPDSVIVVGLGEEGNIKPIDIIYSVKYGVITLAQRIYERDDDTPAQFEFAATLLGSGGANVGPGQAAILIAQGTAEADKAIGEMNERILQADAGAHVRLWPRIGRLHLVEQYMDRAGEAWRALRSPSNGAHQTFLVEDVIRPGQGGLERPLHGGYRGAEYDFVSAISDNDGGKGGRIVFTLNTKRARSEIRAQSTQARLVRDIVKQASNHDMYDRQIGRMLFQLLIPGEMDPFLSGTTDLMLELSDGAAGIPWELLDTHREQHDSFYVWPWAIRTKLIRKLRLLNFRPKPVDADTKTSILVIGEPAASESYGRLPGAREEANAVFGLLSRTVKGDVVALISPDDETVPGPNAIEVISKLMSADWRIIHVSGHGAPPKQVGPGVTKDDHDTEGGVVLTDNIFLGPREINALRVVPELVFVNCCYLAARANSELFVGEERLNRPVFAAGIAQKLIDIGVRCVIAAGWAVDDDAAKIFATTFYEHLTQGARFADAVTEARKRTYEKGGNTWAAYQCYGDPDWILRRGGADAQRPWTSLSDEFDDVASAPGLILALRVIEARCRFGGIDDCEMCQSDRIRLLETRFVQRWGSEGKVAEAFADAWAATKEFKQAIYWYERSLVASDGSASVRSSEQLANLRVRLAWDMVQTEQFNLDRLRQAASQVGIDDAEKRLVETIANARKLIDESIVLIEKLLALHKTQERYNLRGSAYKRLAMIARVSADKSAARTALRLMEKAYAEAESLGRARGDSANLFYPRLNRIAAQVAIKAGVKPMKWSDPELVRETRKLLEVNAKLNPDFWSIVGQIELTMMEAMAAGNLASAAKGIQASYTDLHERVKAPTYWSSVSDQISFLFPIYYERVKQQADERRAVEAISVQIEAYITPVQ